MFNFTSFGNVLCIQLGTAGKQKLLNKVKSPKDDSRYIFLARRFYLNLLEIAKTEFTVKINREGK